MIDNLEGGTISLEHSYAVGPLNTHVGHETLYEGIQDPFERPIWIHVYDFQGASDQDRVALTERQLRAAERSREVDSFGMLLVVDHGELDEGVPFLISERCEGPTLEKILAREGTLSPEETAQLIIRLAELVDPLHRHKRYHGSILSDWIFLPDEEMKRARLGHTHLSLSLEELRRISSPLPFTLINGLAPELLDESEDEEPPPSGSRQADIYALGVLAYRCLCGSHPLLDDTTGGEDALAQLRDDDARDLSELGVDAELAQVIMRALDRDPSKRWSNAPAFGQALGRAAGLFDEPISPTTPPASKPSPAPEKPSPPITSAPEQWEDSLDEPLPTDRRATITGLAVLALLATNGFWLVWTLSQPENSSSSQHNTFTTLNVTSDLQGVNISDISASQETPSELGEAPLTFDLPKSETPLKLELTPGDTTTSPRFHLTFTQDDKPSLELHITQPSP